MVVSRLIFFIDFLVLFNYNPLTSRLSVFPTAAARLPWLAGRCCRTWTPENRGGGDGRARGQDPLSPLPLAQGGAPQPEYMELPWMPASPSRFIRLISAFHPVKRMYLVQMLHLAFHPVHSELLLWTFIYSTSVY